MCFLVLLQEVATAAFLLCGHFSLLYPVFSPHFLVRSQVPQVKVDHPDECSSIPAAVVTQVIVATIAFFCVLWWLNRPGCYSQGVSDDILFTLVFASAGKVWNF